MFIVRAHLSGTLSQNNQRNATKRVTRKWQDNGLFSKHLIGSLLQGREIIFRKWRGVFLFRHRSFGQGHWAQNLWEITCMNNELYCPLYYFSGWSETCFAAILTWRLHWRGWGVPKTQTKGRVCGFMITTVTWKGCHKILQTSFMSGPLQLSCFQQSDPPIRSGMKRHEVTLELVTSQNMLSCW